MGATASCAWPWARGHHPGLSRGCGRPWRQAACGPRDSTPRQRGCVCVAGFGEQMGPETYEDGAPQAWRSHRIGTPLPQAWQACVRGEGREKRAKSSRLPCKFLPHDPCQWNLQGSLLTTATDYFLNTRRREDGRNRANSHVPHSTQQVFRSFRRSHT